VQRLTIFSSLACATLFAISGCGPDPQRGANPNQNTIDAAQPRQTPEESLQHRLGLLRTNDKGKVCAACSVLPTMTDQAARIIPELEKLVNDPDKDIAACAKEALDKLKASSAAPAG
jgi:hypothetical protein